jgi:lysophospholipase L1-like esterase
VTIRSLPAPAVAGVPVAVPAPRTPWTRLPAAPVPRRRSRLLAVAVAVLAVAGTALAVSGFTVAPGVVPAAAPCGPAWSTAWMASTLPVPAPGGLAGGTLRMRVTPQVTGTQVRLRVSNADGTGPLRIGAVTVGRAGPGAAVLPGVAPAGFGGRPDVTLAPGAVVESDAVPLVAEAGVPLAVSVAVTAAPPVVSGHPVALEPAWLARGDVAAEPGAAGFTATAPSWLLATGLDVLAPRPVAAVVAVGDSITDGVGTAPGTDARWTDALAKRLSGAGGEAGMAVLNAGIARNELLATTPAGGATPLARFDRDVAAAAGAADVVLHAGTNDVTSGAGADAVVAGLAAYAGRARAAGKRVVLTTVTPSTHGPAAVRDAVNAWVRDHGREHADAVADFAAAVADPADPRRLAPAFDAGDGLHLNAAGYRALAATVDLRSLSGSSCLAGGGPSRVVLSGH